MPLGKAWFKRIMIVVGITAVVGAGIAGISAAAEFADESRHPFGEHIGVQQNYAHIGEADDDDEATYERDGNGEELELEEWGAGIAAGGALFGGGLLYWRIKRRRKANGILMANRNPVPSVSEFLDQWEQNQTNLKETK